MDMESMDVKDHVKNDKETEWGGYNNEDARFRQLNIWVSNCCFYVNFAD